MLPYKPRQNQYYSWMLSFTREQAKQHQEPKSHIPPLRLPKTKATDMHDCTIWNIDPQNEDETQLYIIMTYSFYKAKPYKKHHIKARTKILEWIEDWTRGVCGWVGWGGGVDGGMRTTSGFRSRWTTPWRWQKAATLKIWTMTTLASSSEYFPPLQKHEQ